MKLFVRFLFFLVTAGNAASSINPVNAPSSLDEALEGKDTKKLKKRADNNDNDQAFYQEKFLALQEKKLVNQVAFRGTTDEIFKSSLMNKENSRVRKKKMIASFFYNETPFLTMNKLL